MKLLANFVFSLLSLVASTQQNPEINDKFEESNHTEIQKHEEITEIKPAPKHTDSETTTHFAPKTIEITTEELAINDVTNITYVAPTPFFITKLYRLLISNVLKFISAPKVNAVVMNIGTCIVNGAMEIVSFYFPAPLIPLIASAAGFIIPFEPIVMLKERMPVTSYRRAFKTAVDGFLGTFDRYKHEEEDPYMTNRFNRRFMGNSKEKE